MLPVALFQDFWDAFWILVVIIDFFMLYRILDGEVIPNSFLTVLVVGVITVILIIPYPLFAYLIFVLTFLYSVFWTFKPYRW